MNNWTQGAKSAFQQQPDESFASAELTNTHMNSDSQCLVGISKTDMAEFGFFVVQGRQPSVLSALMLSFLVSVSMLSVGYAL